MAYTAHIQHPFLIEQYENYQKRTFRNRAIILGPNNADTLTVPLKTGKNNQMPIKEVQISYDEDWITQHLNSLLSYYGNAAFISYYIHEIEQILNSRFTFLWDLNIATMRWSLSKLGIDTDLKFTSSFSKEVKKDYRTLKASSQDNLTIHLSKHLQYAQVYEYKFNQVYIPTILDLLFCTGPEALNYLSSIPDLTPFYPS